MCKCENCGVEHNGNYGSGRFCCKECARSFSTKNDNLTKLKKAKCVKCGKQIYVNKRTSLDKCRCEDCKKEYHKPSDIKNVQFVEEHIINIKVAVKMNFVNNINYYK